MTDRGILLDTGVVVALTNAADPDHARCRAAWSEVRGSLVTVEGVLVEAAHMLRRTHGGVAAAVGLVHAAGAEVVEHSEARYTRALELMDKYRDLPMDLVDGLLVATAEERGMRDILTLDRRGFTVYRIGGRTRFRILP